MARRPGGKLRASKRSHQHFSRRGQEEGEDEVDSFVNPLATPPPVGLSLSSSKTLVNIKFHTQQSHPKPEVRKELEVSGATYV